MKSGRHLRSPKQKRRANVIAKNPKQKRSSNAVAKILSKKEVQMQLQKVQIKDIAKNNKKETTK